MIKIIITEQKEHSLTEIEGIQILTADEYINSEQYLAAKNAKIVNLCHSYQYQSLGYYISLLAEARGHKVIPSIATMQDLRFHWLIRDDTSDFMNNIQEWMPNIPEDQVNFRIYLGECEERNLQRIAKLLFNLFQAPVMEVTFRKKEMWEVKKLQSIPVSQLDETEVRILSKAVETYLMGQSGTKKAYDRRKYDLAILVNPEDATPPSTADTIKRFVKAGEKVGFNVELINKTDFGKLARFDALFIRETTNVNHHTYRFARKAAAEGLTVMDDPTSILRCTNKVYLHELLHKHKVPAPRTAILQRSRLMRNKDTGFDFPLIIKEPDGSFSKGVKKVENVEELSQVLKGFFKKSELLLVQEFLPTDYDWRVGVLDGQVLYVCKYFMARGHWQIIDWEQDAEEGLAETVPLAEVPHGVISTALKAANLIGNGLYGVDLKEKNQQYYVIEVNDNPSIEHGIEDAVAGPALYQQIMQSFMNRVTSRRQ